MNEIPVGDLMRDAKNNILMFKGKPVYVSGVNEEGTLRVVDLINRTSKMVKYDMEAFNQPLKRVGFVNAKGGCVYVSRSPIRRYGFGLNAGNIKVEAIDAEYPEGNGDTRAYVKSLNIPEIGYSMNNQYPSFQDCMRVLSEFPGSMAFDKQFAVSSDGYIFYRTKIAGRIKIEEHKTVDHIKWNDDCEHLALLLEGNFTRTIPKKL